MKYNYKIPNNIKKLYFLRNSIQENPLKINAYLPILSTIICVSYVIIYYVIYKFESFSCDRKNIFLSPIRSQYEYIISSFSGFDNGATCSAVMASHVFVVSVATFIICAFISIINIKRYDIIYDKIIEKGVNFNKVLSSVIMFALFSIMISLPSYFYYFSSVFYGDDIQRANPEIFFVSNSILFSICTAFLSFGFGFWPWWLIRGKSV